MPSFPIECTSIDQAIDQLKLHQKPYWSLWSGTTLKCIHEPDDMESAEQLLAEQLEGMHAIGYDGILTVRVYPNNKKMNSKTGYCGSFNIQLHEKGQMVGHVSQQPNFVVVGRGPQQQLPAAAPGLEAVLLQMAETQKLILDKLNEEEEEDEEDEEPEADDMQIFERKLQMISGIGQQFMPMIQELFNRIFPVKEGSNHTPQNIGDVAENKIPQQEANDRVGQAILALEQKIGTDALVKALEAIAAMPTAKLKGFLIML